MNEPERQRNRADVRRVLRYIRTMRRLKDACPTPRYEGTRMIGIPGDFEMVWAEEGSLEIGFDSVKLTGKEAIDLSLYGELIHVDAAKERKLLRIADSFVSDGYRLAVMSLTAELVRLA